MQLVGDPFSIKTSENVLIEPNSHPFTILQRATLQEKLHRVSGDLVKRCPFHFTDTASTLIPWASHNDH